MNIKICIFAAFVSLVGYVQGGTRWVYVPASVLVHPLTEAEKTMLTGLDVQKVRDYYGIRPGRSFKHCTAGYLAAVAYVAEQAKQSPHKIKNAQEIAIILGARRVFLKDGSGMNLHSQQAENYIRNFVSAIYALNQSRLKNLLETASLLKQRWHSLRFFDGAGRVVRVKDLLFAAQKKAKKSMPSESIDDCSDVISDVLTNGSR